MTGTELDEAMRDAFTGKFMDASDIMGKGNVTVTISDVVAPNKEKDASGKVINRAVLSFDKAKKRFVCGKTNLKIIALMYGTKPSEWIGKKITLGVRYLEKAFGQYNVPTVRVIAPDDRPLTFGMRKHYGSETPFSRKNGE